MTRNDINLIATYSDGRCYFEVSIVEDAERYATAVMDGDDARVEDARKSICDKVRRVIYKVYYHAPERVEWGSLKLEVVQEAALQHR